MTHFFSSLHSQRYITALIITLTATLSYGSQEAPDFNFTDLTIQQESQLYVPGGHSTDSYAPRRPLPPQGDNLDSRAPQRPLPLLRKPRFQRRSLVSPEEQYSFTPNLPLNVSEPSVQHLEAGQKAMLNAMVAINNSLQQHDPRIAEACREHGVNEENRNVIGSLMALHEVLQCSIGACDIILDNHYNNLQQNSEAHDNSNVHSDTVL